MDIRNAPTFSNKRDYESLDCLQTDDPDVVQDFLDDVSVVVDDALEAKDAQIDDLKGQLAQSQAKVTNLSDQLGAAGVKVIGNKKRIASYENQLHNVRAGKEKLAEKLQVKDIGFERAQYERARAEKGKAAQAVKIEKLQNEVTAAQLGELVAFSRADDAEQALAEFTGIAPGTFPALSGDPSLSSLSISSGLPEVDVQGSGDDLLASPRQTFSVPYSGKPSPRTRNSTRERDLKPSSAGQSQGRTKRSCESKGDGDVTSNDAELAKTLQFDEFIQEPEK